MIHGQWEGGKGSGNRTTDREQYRKNYDRLFGKRPLPGIRKDNDDDAATSRD